MSEQQQVETIDYVEELKDNDVLCGRGGGSFKHLGNTAYRHLVNIHKVRFKVAPFFFPAYLQAPILFSLKTPLT
jgi:hypothetical protein